jgi:hypothetical protein
MYPTPLAPPKKKANIQPVLPPRYPLQARSRQRPTDPASITTTSGLCYSSDRGADPEYTRTSPHLSVCHFTSSVRVSSSQRQRLHANASHATRMSCFAPPLKRGEQQIELPSQSWGAANERLNLAQALPMSSSPVISTRQAAAH